MNGVDGVLDSSFQPAAQFRPLIDTVYQELCDRWASGALPAASKMVWLEGAVVAAR